MKIAVTYENGNVFPHFGHTAAFKVYTVEADQVVDAQVISTNGSGHGALAGLLESLDVNALICGGIGGGARFALEDADIEIYGGVSGDADEAVEALLAGQLSFDPNACCSHHHEEGHACGSHGHDCGHHHDHDHSCGSQGCGHHHG